MKSIRRQVAEHLGHDIADIEEYQPGMWTRRVYAGFDCNRYWSAGGNAPPRNRNGTSIVWQRVPSNYPGNPCLWLGE